LAEAAPTGGNGTALPLGRLIAITIAVPDLSVAVDAYRTHLGYRLGDTGYVPTVLAQSWAAPRSAESRFALMSPPGSSGTSLRFVEGPVPEKYVPLRTFG